jgi:16S rRNA (guanine(966)-N(2))-methyltransferase RsmD
MAREKGKSRRNRPSHPPRVADKEPVGLRIVGGRFRSRKLLYHGDARVRPMKDRLRETLFNLVGPAVRDMHAVDLFAGTGALALEALSRGAAGATLIERHLPTVALVRQNVAVLGVEPLCELVADDVFDWFGRHQLPRERPWLVFCSPPYDLFVQDADALLELIAGLMAASPPESIFLVESDERFDFALLPDPDAWRVRFYRPTLLGIWRKQGLRGEG